MQLPVIRVGHTHPNVDAAALTIDEALFTRQPSTPCERFVRPTQPWLYQPEKGRYSIYPSKARGLWLEHETPAMQLVSGMTHDEGDELLTMQLANARFWLMESGDPSHQRHSQETTSATRSLMKWLLIPPNWHSNRWRSSIVIARGFWDHEIRYPEVVENCG